ncbi:dihydropteroate synthase [Devosia pacifica]|uniref:Dihydropteroate synthase n=1 Tax=Devosia pacifica TaxID=1335967 RepID=A0A918RTX4_9HYPH|nr:dihydropteroate synthase [Devosia pacifica]GHA12684.1 dihydropteroate synthase [Devosia pacifica]
MHTTHTLETAAGTLTLGQRPTIMGILNVTPDSFSDGGSYDGVDTAVRQAIALADDGAEIIDIGGESTRPGAEEVQVQDELDRVMPILDALKAISFKSLISIDTYKPLVADQALQAGACIINDVYGLQRDPEMADVAALHKAPLIAMHWDKNRDRDKPLLDEVRRWFDRTIATAENAGMYKSQLILDPGFGFAKTLDENYRLLRELGSFYPGYPIAVGTSRKSMIGKLLNREVDERLPGTIATNVLGYQSGAHLFRVHDPRPVRDALMVAAATLYSLGVEGAQQ